MSGVVWFVCLALLCDSSYICYPIVLLCNCLLIWICLLSLSPLSLSSPSNGITHQKTKSSLMTVLIRLVRTNKSTSLRERVLYVMGLLLRYATYIARHLSSSGTGAGESVRVLCVLKLLLLKTTSTTVNNTQQTHICTPDPSLVSLSLCLSLLHIRLSIHAHQDYCNAYLNFFAILMPKR